jgi:hypothetical protein
MAADLCAGQPERILRPLVRKGYDLRGIDQD